MAIVLIPVTAQSLTRDHVRQFMRDTPPGMVPGTGSENVLLDGVEFSNQEIDSAVMFTTARYNAMTPISSLTAEMIPSYPLLMGTAAHLLKAESMKQLRNQATTQDGDVPSLGIDDKWQQYRQLAVDMSEEFEKYARAIKTQKNMQAAYGGVGSGYVNVSRRYSP